MPTTGDQQPARFASAIGLIDAANAADPVLIEVGGKRGPKELIHAEMLTEWVRRLRPDASEALLLAARGHHIRRWAVPRSSYPEGRHGYLRWRTTLSKFHADAIRGILESAAYDTATIERVCTIIRKEGLKGRDKDEDAQTLEDALCLVFLQTQYDDLIQRIDADKMVTILRRTWGKMSPKAHELALQLPLSPEGSRLVQKALAPD